MFNEINSNTNPVNNQNGQGNVISQTQAQPTSPQIADLPLPHLHEQNSTSASNATSPVGAIPRPVLASDIVYVLLDAYPYLDLSNFDCHRTPNHFDVDDITETNLVILPIIEGFRDFIKNASDRVCSALAFIANYDYSSIHSFTKDDCYPNPGFSSDNVLNEILSQRLLSEYYTENPLPSHEVEDFERDHLLPLSYNRSEYPPTSRGLQIF